jgi:sugar/nucleoside kinase (ribokinase family)
VGDVMMDVSVSSSGLARGGDVHGHVRLRPGGTATNAAVWAASIGASVQVIGRVGDDLSGRLLAEALRERGVEPLLAVDRSASTGTMLVVHEANERSMVADRGANAHLSPDDLPAEIEAGAVLISGYALFQPGSSEAARVALERSRASVVAVDAASWPLIRSFGVERFFSTSSKATALLANQVEAQELTGARGSETAEILAKRYAMVAVKLGSNGALLAVDGRIVHATAPPVDEIDPTGAGDAFDGVLLAGLARGADPEAVLEAACEAGASAASSPDPWPPLVKKADA